MATRLSDFMDFEDASRRILNCMFHRIARVVEVLQRRKSLPRRDTNEVIPEHHVAQNLAKKRLRDSDMSVATWLPDFTDFDDATSRILKLYVLSHCSRCRSAATAQVIAPERYFLSDTRAPRCASLSLETVAGQRSVRGNLAV